MYVRLRFSRTTSLCDPYESKNPCEISVELQDGFFGHNVSLPVIYRSAFADINIGKGCLQG
jgi:hypothetical protein